MKRIILFISIVIFSLTAFSQNNKIPAVNVKTMEGKSFNTGNISNDGKPIVISFWATWCKPCVAELPEFEKLHIACTEKGKKVKVLLVSMDFVEELDKKLKDFLAKNKYTSEVVFLDEVNGNDFINKISEQWSGAIPATLITRSNNLKKEFHEGKLTIEMLEKMISEK